MRFSNVLWSDRWHTHSNSCSKKNPADNVNRKKFHGIIMQAVVDSNYLFRDRLFIENKIDRDIHKI